MYGPQTLNPKQQTLNPKPLNQGYELVAVDKGFSKFRAQTLDISLAGRYGCLLGFRVWGLEFRAMTRVPSMHALPSDQFRVRALAAS